MDKSRKEDKHVMDYTVHKDRRNGEFPGDRSRSQGIRRKKGKKEKVWLCDYIKLGYTRTLTKK